MQAPAARAFLALIRMLALLLLAPWALIAADSPAPAGAAAGKGVDFTRQIRPILEQRCLGCHGEEKQRGSFRLDQGRAALKGGDSGVAIVPGKSAESPLIHRVMGNDGVDRMPPEGEALTPEQVAQLARWIDDGAHWPDAEAAEEGGAHWAFQPVRRPDPPRTGDAMGLAPIDAFIVERLEKAGLGLSPEAPRRTLIRRLYFVMLGVPPTPEDVAAFESDPDDRAFERLVDRVLADPRYGERWGRHWLDVVRFAESNGFETNRERPNAWRYRDYVIDAFNRDLPFDRFIREQVAGDALGNDVATGFLVAGPVDIVGSPDPVLTAQQRADELDDMVNTTGTAFLGLTLGCARCHNHKFDPVEQREYYALTAVFSGVRHGDRALRLPREAAEQATELDGRITDLERRLARFLARPSAPPKGSLKPPLNPRLNTETFATTEARFLRFTIHATTGGEPCLDELEVYSGDRNIALASAGTKATASGTLPGFDIHRLEHIHDGRTGNDRSWISSENGRGWVQLEFATAAPIDRVVWGRDREGRFADRLAVGYRIEVAVEPGQWRRVAGSEERPPYKPGSETPAPPAYDFDGLSEAEARQGRDWLAQLEAARKRRAEVAKPPMAYAGTFTQPAPAHRLHRGDPMQKREPVSPGTLGIFLPVTMAADEPEQQRRVRLADWLSSDANPLTPRVIVNRLWQHHFGVGWVDTPNDFGRNGSPPTHPELLDWMASELVARGWSLKTLHRQILLSATWRQSSAPNPAGLRVDAGSRLLWRFPPRRLEAEAVRDAILQVAGTLNSQPGGPGFHLLRVERENVYHYHPRDDFGPAEFRRMVYAYKIRMEQDDVFGAFDCPDGSLVVPRRGASTTALQALNLFNSRFVLDQADRFAARAAGGPVAAAEPDAAAYLAAWRLAFQREPAPGELADARALARDHGFAAVTRALLNANEFLFIP
jgi:mono/diheme cytochrome c family protein